MTSQNAIPDNHILVIFGASGDLTERKLIPALFDLYCRKLLPTKFAILGIGRTEYEDDAYRDKVATNNQHLRRDVTAAVRKEFGELIHYQSLDTLNIDDYGKLKDRIGSFCQSLDIDRNLIFYLSTPPSLYEKVATGLNKFGLNNEENGWSRLIVEKPFGYDLASAKSLNRHLLECFFEDQIFRIDHYLGKETVQNLMVTRFANTIFEPLFNRIYINRVEITAAESVGVEKRGGYYDGAGALRDMVQNHLLQLVSMVAMEPPSSIESGSIRNEKLKLFQSLRPLSEEEILTDVIRGQYVESKVKGELLKGYRQEDGVDPDSRTETFAALKFHIDNWRWAGVPFYIRTGKRLPTRVSEVVIHFKPNHHHLFRQKNIRNSQNILVFRIQPNEGILLKFGLKVPGLGYNVDPVNMDFHYDELSEAYIPDAYERLLLDCMNGDATLFARGDSVEAAWQFIDPILSAWKTNHDIPIYGYPAGTWGPENMDELIEGENMVWRYPCKNLADDGIYCEL